MFSFYYVNNFLSLIRLWLENLRVESLIFHVGDMHELKVAL